MLEETSDQTDIESQDKMENKEDEESGDFSKEDEVGIGSCSATTSEVDEVAAISSVKSEGEGEEKTSTTESSGSSSGSSSETILSPIDEPTAQSSTLPPSSSRLMRNLAEKMRRDKLNMYISELSTLVPIVALATKRMDKTSVLRLSANFLRIHLSLKQNKKKETVKFAPEGLESTTILSTTLLEALEGFMLIVTASGKIVYVSDSVEKLLGHSQLDLMGQSLYTICHTGDTELLRHHLQPSTEFQHKSRDEEADSDGSSSTALVDYVPRSPSFFGGKPEDALSGLASGERRSFYVRLAERSMGRGDPARHVQVHLIGILRPPVNKKDPKAAGKGKKECSSTTGTGDEHLLVCVAKPLRNKRITELSLMEAVQDEYVTRHLPDGRIIYSDHRIAFVAGYLTEEVLGLSAFNFIHQEDLPWATVANRQMFSSVEGQGYSVYRLRSKTGSLIHLRTRGFLEFNKTTQKVETFVCINTLLTNEEGDKELEKERERITPFITYQHVTSSTSTNTSTAGGNSAAQSTITNLTTSSNALLPALEFEVNSVRKTKAASTLKSQLIISTPPSSHSSNSCNIVSSDDRCQMSPATNESSVPSEVQVTVNEVGDFICSPGAESECMMSISSPAQISCDLSESKPDLEDHPQCVQTIIHVSSPSQSVVKIAKKRNSRGIDSLERGTIGDLLPRLKRSFPDVDDVFMTSAKRSIVVPAFISSYSNLHHSPPLSPTWDSDASTTSIIFDQHNNNG